MRLEPALQALLQSKDAEIRKLTKDRDGLQIKVAGLEDEVWQLKRILGASGFLAPHFLSLTKGEELILGMLFARDYCSKEALYDVAYPGNESSANSIEVRIHKIRKKLRPYGITIHTTWGRGYLITKEGKLALKQLIDEAAK